MASILWVEIAFSLASLESASSLPPTNSTLENIVSLEPIADPIGGGDLSSSRCVLLIRRFEHQRKLGLLKYLKIWSGDDGRVLFPRTFRQLRSPSRWDEREHSCLPFFFPALPRHLLHCAKLQGQGRIADGGTIGLYCIYRARARVFFFPHHAPREGRTIVRSSPHNPCLAMNFLKTLRQSCIKPSNPSTHHPCPTAVLTVSPNLLCKVYFCTCVSGATPNRKTFVKITTIAWHLSKKAKLWRYAIAAALKNVAQLGIALPRPDWTHRASKIHN